MENKEVIRRELLESKEVLDQFLSNETNLEKINAAALMITDSLSHGGKVISCGNGGSHCDAMHFAEELTGRFRDDRDPLAAIAIADPSHMSCTSNDYGFEEIFARFIKGLGRTGDVLFGLSTSGNSPNMVRAFEQARTIGMPSIALTGKTGGKLAELADLEIRVPHMGYSDRIQEVHIKIIHILILLIEKQLT